MSDELVVFAHRMFDLARDGQAADLAAHLDAGLPVDLTDEKGDTLLIVAAYHGSPDAVATLLDHGADVSRTNDRGQTALAAATFHRVAESVRLLLAAGADPDQGSPSARAAADYFGLTDMAELLR